MNAEAQKKLPLTILLAGPRGFCAGVDRAIKIVEKALEKYGAPVYVRHEIVHNRYVVESLEKKGAIFVKELDQVPDAAPVIFSAHGVAKSVPLEAKRRNLFHIDATCPLVSKVHRETEKLNLQGKHILLIGHKGHPEVIGTMGQIPEGSITLIETVEDALSVPVPDPTKVTFVTQTTLSVDDTADIVAALRKRFPSIDEPRKEDICYATTNRQAAVKDIAAKCDLFLVVGAANSSNSNRLVEVALKAGCPSSHLIRMASDIDWSWLDNVRTVGLSAGASAPEELVQGVIEACRQKFDVTVVEADYTKEDVIFHLPKAVRDERSFDRDQLKQSVQS